MTERIDKLQYETSERTREKRETSLFLTGPAEFLCQEIVAKLSEASSWRRIFGDSLDPYARRDYSMRALPAARVYIPTYKKDFESWYVHGYVHIDVIYPPSLRRDELEQVPSTIATALTQQFRSPAFFRSLCARVPGLNELGKFVDVDKALGFEISDDEIVPMTQITMNFRINLDEWDWYAESDDRTIDDPFTRTLGDLERIVGVIEGLRDDDEIDVKIDVDQTIE